MLEVAVLVRNITGIGDCLCTIREHRSWNIWLAFVAASKRYKHYISYAIEYYEQLRTQKYSFGLSIT